MKFLPVSVALVLSAAAGIATTGAAFPPPARKPPVIQPDGPPLEVVAKKQRKKPIDCHRDVRTHRIDGVLVRHRHVGESCAVREVRKADSY